MILTRPLSFCCHKKKDRDQQGSRWANAPSDVIIGMYSFTEGGERVVADEAQKIVAHSRPFVHLSTVAAAQEPEGDRITNPKSQRRKQRQSKDYLFGTFGTSIACPLVCV